MLTFLKKLGSILVNVAGIATGIGPIITPFLGSGKSAEFEGKAVNDLTQIGSLVLVIETAFAAVPNSTGAQKLQALIPLVANVVKTSEIVSGKKIADDAKFIQGCGEVAQGMVDILQSIHPDEAQHA